ncbi:DUF1735 domain-containing protein [Pedobacter sp. ASV12]|uniref:DUF1735 domain-containing protein n=1 Tax=Pedobacter sp. ASV12 TaxID=2795120 RepID=UPI0018EB8C91
MVEFKNPSAIKSPSGAVYASFNHSYPLESTSATFTVQVDYTGSDVAPQDIPITIDINPTAVDDYNTQQHTSLLRMHEAPYNSLYTLNTTSAVIPKGGRYANVTVSLKPSLFNPAVSYGLALRIKSATGANISANFGTIIVIFGAKNKYDGIYQVVNGNVQRYSAPGSPTIGDALNGSLKGNSNVTLTTIDANTVEITGMKWSGNASGIAGIDNLRATVDPVTNLVTMKALGNTTLANMAGKDNKYDPATKTFTLNFNWNPTGAVREITGLVLTYSGVR